MCKTFRIQWGNKPSFQKLTLKLGNQNICYFQALVIIIIATICWGPCARAPQGTSCRFLHVNPAAPPCSRSQYSYFTDKEVGQKDKGNPNRHYPVRTQIQALWLPGPDTHSISYDTESKLGQLDDFSMEQITKHLLRLPTSKGQPSVTRGL